MELLLLVFFCLLTGSEVTFGAENGSKDITVEKGSDVILPCSLNTTDITNKKFEWKKDGRQVFLYDDGDHSNNAGTGQDQQFVRRVEHFTDKLKSGDASITIINMKMTDSGEYTCEFPDLLPSQTFHFQLRVFETKVIKVEKGRDVTLPCSLNTEDITNKKFEWKKDGRQVFLYDAGDHSNIVNTFQDQQFRGRVEHFPDKLKSGNASITIRNMKVADSGNYTCEFTNLQPSQIFYVKLVVEATVIKVKEGSDVTLPCSLNTEDITKKKFEWKKNGRQVFLYDAGDHSNIVNTGQDQQFRGRVEHFPDKLKSGNASITIRNTNVADTGEYTCEFPDLQPKQMFHIKFVLVEAPQPSVKILDQRKFSAELQCEVRGAFPKPELHWQDGAGNKLLARDPQVTERGGLYDVILQTIVTKTDIYRCVATQKEINHQTDDDIHVFTGYIGGDIAAIVIAVVVVGVVGVVGLVFVVYIRRYRIKSCFRNDASPKPSVRIYHQTPRAAVLQCEVRGAFPKPKLHWEDREGVLPAPEPEVTKRGGHYDVILKTVVYKTGNYRCVATQKEINHQAHDDIHVHITGKTIIIMEEGSDVILPCSLGSRPDITNNKFVWKKGGCLMFLYDNGPVNDNNQTQDQQFKGRVSHFRDELKSGNASIIIRDMKKADTGNYTCEFPDLQPSQIFHIELVLEPTVIRVEEGRDATLPCSLSSRQDITSEKFVWKKAGHQVFLYDKGPVNDSSQTQDQQFKGRVKHFPDELKSGKTSITIRDMKKADTGEYTCEFPDLQPSQIFHIVLVVAPNPRDDETAGLLANETDGGAVKDSRV